MRHTSTDPPWGVIFLVVKRLPVVGDRSRSFGSRDYGGWMKPVDQLSTIAANRPASPLAQPRERNKINHSLPAVRRKLTEGTSMRGGTLDRLNRRGREATWRCWQPGSRRRRRAGMQDRSG